MEIKYPNRKQQTPTQRVKSRGLMLENALNTSNEFYLMNNRAVIYKKPTPIQVVKVNYPKRSRARITEAYYRNKSTTDYNGLYRGKYIDFEAKETNNLSFNFKHISQHQIEHLKKVHDHGGIAFIIVLFKRVEKVYLLPFSHFYNLYRDSLKKGKKSIKIDQFETLGKQLQTGYAPMINYLDVVDQLFFKKKR